MTLGPAVRTVAAPDSYRQAPGETGPALARAVREAIADLARHGLRPAALMVDTIFSSDGVQAGPAGFLREAVDAIHEAGGLFIADEVQAGMGRTGETLWGYMRHGVAPDLITMGKPLGNGHPGRRGGQAASAGGFRPQQPLLQHLWRQSGIGGGRPGRVAHGAAGRADAERRARRRLFARAPARIGRAS